MHGGRPLGAHASGIQISTKDNDTNTYKKQAEPRITHKLVHQTEVDPYNTVN